VIDASGRPVAGIAVRGIPWSRDLPWTAPATTACDGSFRLPLPAPGSFGFLLIWQGTSLITPSPEDPSRVTIQAEPGQRHEGVELIFLGPAWRRAISTAPAQTPTCP